MGCCFAKPKKSLVEIVPSDQIRSLPVVSLHGSSSGIQTSLLRLALSYKPVSVNFISSETQRFGSDTPVLVYHSDTVTGSCETLLRYIDDKFPTPLLLSCVGAAQNQAKPPIVSAATLQHKSMSWHLERLVTWADDLATRGARSSVDPSLGTPTMEVKKFGKSYSLLLELMLEHAQMEERIVFPALESAERGLCKVANEEHARDLPIMNGIKECIKSIGVLQTGDSAYQEAFFNLSTRLKTLQEHCREHFEEEERELWPLLEAVEPSEEKQVVMLKQCVEVMESTHSRLFKFMVEGLVPREAMQYLDIMIRYGEDARVLSLLLSVLMNKNR